jgi:NAD(P)-dependent dehydrogenase (short-subunit alcohol dehydrogenase family)
MPESSLRSNASKDTASRGAPTALVTGGASGIGRATVTRLLADGWSVVATDLNAETGARLVAELDAGDRLVFVRGDVSRESDVANAVATAVQRFGTLDGLVNNAAVGGAFGPVTELEVDDWDATFAVLVRGVYLGIKHAARVMKTQGGGSIVNVASLAGMFGDQGPQAYSVAKASVLHMARVFGTELGPFRIRVNAVCPGAIATPLNPVASAGIEGTVLEAMQPLPLAGQPRHLASTIAFLLSDDAEFITGQAIAVDGGLAGAGPRLGEYLGTDPRGARLVGMNFGSTGQKAQVRRAVEQSPS